MQWRPPADADGLVLAVHAGMLELRAREDRPGTGIHVDLAAIDARGLSRTPLVRAMGGRVRTVADATAGLLGDAWRLALAGFEVTAFERSPAVARLCRDGLERAACDPRIDRAALSRLHFEEGDARAALAPGSFDAVLVDPMFPPKRRASALPRKEVQVLRAAVGDDPDAADLLAAARRTARVRTVVKRADDAPVLADSPSIQAEGRTVRFDVYLAASAPEAAP